uniref:Uncharacterized protein n=1 Tax=Oryza brachyantha TaxID=4533 RepID=J3N7Q9_ORYBR
MYRINPMLLWPGRMDMHVYMGYCGWDTFKTLVHSYFVTTTTNIVFYDDFLVTFELFVIM